MKRGKSELTRLEAQEILRELIKIIMVAYNTDPRPEFKSRIEQAGYDMIMYLLGKKVIAFGDPEDNQEKMEV